MVTRTAPAAGARPAARSAGRSSAQSEGAPDSRPADDAAPPLPWLAEPLARVLASQRGHATLLQAAAGNGALEFGLLWARAGLCEAAAASSAACGHCASCKLVAARLHPDLFVLLPEDQRRAHGWLLASDKPDGDDAKRKPSRQIRIDDVRGLIDWSHKTSARGRGKVALLHPADTMNAQAASALLKTLEEPPPGTRLLLTAADADWLLPTVRSRCQLVPLQAPPPAQAAAWLAAQDVAHPQVLLAACNGRPLDALALARAGVTAETWAALPRSIAHGQAAALAGWPPPQAVDALQKLCHDAMALAVGGAPAYFPADRMPRTADLQALVDWNAELLRVARHADHPWNDGLLLEALVGQGSTALAGPVGPHGRRAEPFDTLAR